MLPQPQSENRTHRLSTNCGLRPKDCGLCGQASQGVPSRCCLSVAYLWKADIVEMDDDDDPKGRNVTVFMDHALDA